MENIRIRTADDYIWDTINAFMAGNMEQAEVCLAEAINDKLETHCMKCLEDVYKDA